MDAPPPPAAPWWLPGPTGQTIWARVARSRRLIRFAREVLPTPDEDDLILDHVDARPGAPRVLLLHGLEGSAYSLHTQGLAALVAAAGWSCTVLNFRSCARDPNDIKRRLPNRRPRLYHSGETEDLDLVVRTLVRRDPAAPLYAVGFSLGGNVLIKYLGEQGAGGRDPRGGDAVGSLRPGGGLALPRAPGGARLRLPLPAAAQAEGAGRRGPLSARDSAPGRRAHPRRAYLLPNSIAASPRRCTALPAQRTITTAPARSATCRRSPPPRSASAPKTIRSFRARAWRARGRRRRRTVRFQVTTWGGHTGFVGGRWPWRPHYWAEEMAISWLARAIQ